MRRGTLELSFAMPDEELQSLGNVRLGLRVEALSVELRIWGRIILVWVSYFRILIKETTIVFGG